MSQRQLNALPMTRSKIFEKLMSAWPRALQNAMNAGRRPSPNRKVSIPAFRNAGLARNPSGRMSVVYFPDN